MELEVSHPEGQSEGQTNGTPQGGAQGQGEGQQREEGVGEGVGESVSPPPTAAQSVTRSPGHNGKPDSYSEEFATFWAAYPKRAGGNPRKQALTKYIARRREGISAETLLAGAQRYGAFCKATDKLNTEYVKQAASWLSPTFEGWSQKWDLPRPSRREEEDARPSRYGNEPAEWHNPETGQMEPVPDSDRMKPL